MLFVSIVVFFVLPEILIPVLVLFVILLFLMIVLVLSTMFIPIFESFMMESVICVFVAFATLIPSAISVLIEQLTI